MNHFDDPYSAGWERWWTDELSKYQQTKWELEQLKKDWQKRDDGVNCPICKPCCPDVVVE